MHKKHLIFIIPFIIVIFSLLYLLGATVTGFATQSMHCEDGICKPLCKSNIDCGAGNEICCEKNNFGICELSSLCEKPYKFQPGMELGMEFDIDLGEKAPVLEMPSSVRTEVICIYIGLILLVLMIGIIYFLNKKILNKKSKKKK